MPWCGGCDRFLSPSTVAATGECPRCGAAVEPGRARPPAANPTPEPTPEPTPNPEPHASGDETPLPVPWHFKLLVGALALYLGWRAFQGLDWVWRQL